MCMYAWVCVCAPSLGYPTLGGSQSGHSYGLNVYLIRYVHVLSVNTKQSIDSLVKYQ